MKKHKLFVSYLQQKPSKSIELAAAKQKHSNDIAKTQQTFQQKLHFLDFVDYSKFCYVFAMFYALQQLILYFLMVFVANSLYFFIFASYLQQKP